MDKEPEPVTGNGDGDEPASEKIGRLEKEIAAVEEDLSASAGELKRRSLITVRYALFVAGIAAAVVLFGKLVWRAIGRRKRGCIHVHGRI